MSMAVIGGAFGALAAGLTTQAARWLWDTFLAILSFGWNALAAPRLRGRGRSRSACVVNGRLRHAGEGAVRPAPPCVVSRV